jgi:glycosyltransferase involved in cell wall biosynthesis
MHQTKPFNRIRKPNPELWVYSKYDRRSGGARVRVFDWLAETNADSVVRTFADYDPENRSSQYLSATTRYVANQVRLECEAREVQHAQRSVLVYRQATPFGRGGVEARLLRSASFGVFDFDDAIHLQASAGRFGLLFPPPLKTAMAIAAADRVIAGNDYLADWAAGFSKDVSVVPSCVSPERYAQKSNYEVSDTPTIGWIGSHSTDRYLDQIRLPLLELHKRTGARILLIGAIGENRGELEKMIDRVQWTEENQHELLAKVDIGIMPLPDTEFARGKCAYKLLQYGAAGVPSVGSPVGTNTSVLKGSGGWAPSTDAEWLDAMIDALSTSPKRRQQIGDQARVHIQAHYSFAAWRSTWENLVLGRPVIDGAEFQAGSQRNEPENLIRFE